ncbi:MAG: RHS repeat-associated core domain-containing protein [Candidatus Promineifilaceae bacterium]
MTAYVYDQRNLLTAATLDGQPLADYVYGGAGNRLQQVEHSSGQPVTTTYANDILGLSQLLADGLGSVRSEMARAAVQSTITYEPYGNLLVQAGASTSVYGFTGEQEDVATGLLYLRARYYSPGLKVFASRDPWQGTVWRPANQGTLGAFCNILMLTKALYGRLPERLPATLEAVIDGSVKDGAELSPVRAWAEAAAQAIVRQGRPIPAALVERIAPLLDRRGRQPVRLSQGHWLRRPAFAHLGD